MGKEPTEVPFGVVLTVNGGDGSETRQRVADSVDRPLFESFAAMEWLAMMGRLNHDQRQLFYSFRLEDAVPDDHLVRAIAGVLDLSWVHAELAPYYPKAWETFDRSGALMIRMLAVGYVFAIRSERALCRDVQVNLAYRWFCDLSIEDKVPDHSAFSRARNERFRNTDVFRTVFERVVEACIRAGLVGGEGFAVDASLIVADANKQRSIPGAEWAQRSATAPDPR